MTSIADVMNSDILVFSSHKTATQSVKKTLNDNGIACVHGHHFNHIGMTREDMLPTLRAYRTRHGTPLTIISVYREPLERHMSSFFQTYGWRPIKNRDVSSAEETIIYKYSIADLQARFLEEIRTDKLSGQNESLVGLSNCLEVPLDRLKFDPALKIGVNEFEDARVFIFRFDQLISDFSAVLASAIGHDLAVSRTNVSDEKWYNQKYKEFRSTISFPKEIVEKVYRPRLRSFAAKMYGMKTSEYMGKTLAKYCT